MKRIRGRPRLKVWCKLKGIKGSEAIRAGLGQIKKEGNLSELLENREYRKHAIELLNEIKEGEK